MEGLYQGLREECRCCFRGEENVNPAATSLALRLSAHSGWLSANKDAFTTNGGKTFAENPVDVLTDTYHFLNLDNEGSAAASEQIWSHDAKMLDTADAFYLDAINELDVDAWADLCAKLEGDAPTGMDADTWAAIQGAHQGHQAGLSLLLLLPALPNKRVLKPR